MLPNPLPYFAKLEDPRRETYNKKHKLEDIIFVTLCAVLSGCEDWVAIEDFGCEHEAWLRKFIELPNGIPSHDTLSKVIGQIKKEAFEEAFTDWMRDGLPELRERHIALDGKSLRGSRDKNGFVHMISAFATEAKLVLTARSVGEKNNEITEIPHLLDQFNLSGTVITIDAMGCQKEIAQKIIRSRGDYVFGLKKNHPTLYEDIKWWMEKSVAEGYVYQCETLEKGHGRIETRRVSLSTDLGWLEQKKQWPGLNAVVMIESIREAGDKRSVEHRYYLTSLSKVERVAQVIRHHWAIENQQHWLLDVQFGEDENRARKNHSASNLALIRRTALNLLPYDTSDKRSIRRRKWRALADENYREKLLFGETIDKLS